MINIENELATWVIDYITNSVHNTETDNPKFNNWAKAFEQEEAKFLVSMEFGNDWGYDTREEITEEEAEKYAQALLKVVLRVNGFPMKYADGRTGLPKRVDKATPLEKNE